MNATGRLPSPRLPDEPPTQILHPRALASRDNHVTYWWSRDAALRAPSLGSFYRLCVSVCVWRMTCTPQRHLATALAECFQLRRRSIRRSGHLFDVIGFFYFQLYFVDYAYLPYLIPETALP